MADKDFTFIAKITYYDEDDDKTVCVLGYCDDFTDAMAQIEKSWYDDIINVDITVFGGSILEFPVKMYEMLKENMNEI